MRVAGVTLLATGLIFAQSGSETKDPKRAAATAKGRELLAVAEAALGSADPSVQVAATIGLADAYRAFDRKKSLDLLRQAFDAAATLPGIPAARQRLRFQVDVARQVAGMDLPEARKMLATMPAADSGDYDPRVWAAYRVVELQIEKKQFDAAMETVNSLHGAYPHGAASLILAKLPEGDPRRIIIFGQATTAFNTRADRAFIHLLARHWRGVPRRMAQSALDAALQRTLESKDDGSEMMTISTEKETVSLRSAQDADLFELMPVLRALEPARAEEILGSRRELRALLSAHPEGSQSLKGKSQMAIKVGRRPGAPPPDLAQQARTGANVDLAAASLRQSAAAMATLKENPQAALSAARSIALPARRAEVLAAIASAAARNDPAAAGAALREALTLTGDLKEPGDRIGVWDSIAGAAHAAGDDKLTADAIEKGMADAAELYRKDADQEKRNPRPRHAWPSTEAFLRIIRRAATLLGPEAEPLLLRITDPDLNLLARLELARVLLGRTETVNR